MKGKGKLDQNTEEEKKEKKEEELKAELARIQTIIQIASQTEGLGCQTDSLYT